METRKRNGGRVAALMIATLVLGACGGDNGGSSTTTGPTSWTAPAPGPRARQPSPSTTQGINVTGTYRGAFNTSTGTFPGTYTLTQTGTQRHWLRNVRPSVERQWQRGRYLVRQHAHAHIGELRHHGHGVE